MKFINLSPTEDFYLKFQSQLGILMKNVLYITHELDQVKKIVKTLERNNNLQKQVDDYFSKDEEEGFSETSPQTDSEEH